MRTRFLLNILLTFVWVALTGSFEYQSFLFGFFLSFFIMWIISRNDGIEGNDKYFTLAGKIISFILFFLYELLLANLQVAYDVITPKFHMKPGIIRVPLDAKTPLEITLLANLISLTPGSLSLDVSADKKALYVHAMYVHDEETFVRGIKDGFERRLLEILR
jgi:multicomponent Na+:H+ antiporter subunit E